MAISLPLLLLASEVLLLALSLRLRILPVFIPTKRSSSQMRPLASSRSQIGIPRQRSLTPSAIVGAVRTSTSSRGATLKSGGVRRSRSEVEFPARIRVSSPSSSSSRSSEVGGVDGRLSPRHSAWPTQKWFPALLRLQVEEVCRLSTLPEVVDLASGRPPLPRLPLLAWSLTGGSTTSTSRTPPSPTSAAVGEDRQLDDMTPLGVFLRPLHSVDVSVVADYLSFFFESGRAFRTIMLHRSSFSSILPLFEGVSVGYHPVLSHLCSVFFDKRPPPLGASFHRGTWRQCLPSSTDYSGHWTFSAAPSSSPWRRLGVRRSGRLSAVIRHT